jgi:energy-coupling factor transport system substrate-specific component
MFQKKLDGGFVMKRQSMWSFRLSTAAFVLIPTAVGINYIGKLFAGLLKLPLWLDSIGTVLASILAGPIVGALSGAINNIIYGLTVDPISFVYGITSIAIGLTVGILFFKGWISSWSKAFVTGLIIGLVAAVVSTPINVGFWGGQTGNVWGDALYAIVLAKTDSIWLSSFLDEIVVDVPDKLMVILVSFGIFKGLPRNVVQLYKTNNKVENLD